MTHKLYVQAPPGNGYTTPQTMQRIDDDLVQRGLGTFTKENDLPTQQLDGSWEIQVKHDPRLINDLLKVHYGLDILHELES